MHAPVAHEYVLAVLRQHRATAAGAAFRGFDERRVEEAVELVDELPRALVAHAHAPSGGGDRAGIADAFEQVGLARPEIDARREAQAQTDELREIVRLFHAGPRRSVSQARIHAPMRRSRQLPEI